MNIKHISRADLTRWKEEGKDFQLIDVREASEHQEFNIGGELLPLSEINRLSAKIESNKPIVFYCRKGIRSLIAIQRLQSKFPDADFYNLTSGIYG